MSGTTIIAHYSTSLNSTVYKIASKTRLFTLCITESVTSFVPHFVPHFAKYILYIKCRIIVKEDRNLLIIDIPDMVMKCTEDVSWRRILSKENLE